MSFRRSVLAAAAAGAVIALGAGCADNSTPAPAGNASPAPATTGSAATGSGDAGSATTPGTVIPGDSGGVTTTQAAQLCSDMDAQLQNWRTYTPTIGKGGLNTVVGSWAAQNGVNMIDLVTHKARIDVITSAQCPEVRDGALYALEIPDLASGLIGF